MNNQEEEWMIRRILVALDASQHSLEALKAAVNLASSLEAEVLEGLFVEDVNLLKIAGLSIAREVRYPFNVAARLEPARMERQLRAQATQARQALVTACERKHIKWSFRVVRGEVARKVLEAAEEADLLSLGMASRPLFRRSQAGSTARAAAMGSSRSVLIIPQGADIRPPIVVAHDGSSSMQQTIKLAARLAQHVGDYLSVLVLSNAPSTSKQIQTEISEWLQGQDMMIHYRELVGSGVHSIVEAVRTEGSGVLVLKGSILPKEDIQVLLDEVNCPVMLIR